MSCPKAGTLLEGEDFGYRLESQLPDMEMSLPLPEFRKVRLGGESSVLEVQAVLQKIFAERISGAGDMAACFLAIFQPGLIQTENLAVGG